jgi:hypothetical protein
LRQHAWASSFSCVSGITTSFAAIDEPGVIARILTHLGLPARAPPRSPARAPLIG